MNCAPFAVTTLCRYEHLRKLIESLQKNSYAKYTDLYIGLDYPAKPAHEPGYKKICEFLDAGVEGFKSVNVFKRDKNYGARENSRQLFAAVWEKHDTMISSEDDNEFSPNFLEYMNKALEKYWDDPKIYKVCAYSFPIDFENRGGNIVETNFINAWGIGSWKHKKGALKMGTEYYEKKLRNPFAAYRLIENSLPAWFHVFEHILEGTQVKYGDYRMSAYFSINKLYAVAPRVSMVKNNGLDGSGIHCQEWQDEVFNARPIDDRETFEIEGELCRLTKQDKFNITKLHYKNTKAGQKKAYYLATLYAILGKKLFCKLLKMKNKDGAKA